MSEASSESLFISVLSDVLRSSGLGDPFLYRLIRDPEFRFAFIADSGQQYVPETFGAIRSRFDERQAEALHSLLQQLRSANPRCIQIVGKSGSGKTALTRALVGIDSERRCHWVNCDRLTDVISAVSQIRFLAQGKILGLSPSTEFDIMLEDNAYVVFDGFRVRSRTATEFLNRLITHNPMMTLVISIARPLEIEDSLVIDLSKKPAVEKRRSNPLTQSVALAIASLGPTNIDASTILKSLTTSEQRAVQSACAASGLSVKSVANRFDSKFEQQLEKLADRGLVTLFRTNQGTSWSVPNSISNAIEERFGASHNALKSICLERCEVALQLASAGDGELALREVIQDLPTILSVAKVSLLGSDYQTVQSIFASLGRLLFESSLDTEFHQLLRLAQRIPVSKVDPEFRVRLLGLSGAYKAVHGDSEGCVQDWQLRAKLSARWNLAETQLDATSDLASFYLERNDIDNCLGYCTSALDLIQSNPGLTDYRTSVEVVLARAYLKRQDNERAMQVLRDVTDHLPDCSRMNLLPFVYQNMVVAYADLGDSRRERMLLADLIVLATRMGRTFVLGWCFERAAIHMDADGDSNSATHSLVIALRLLKSSTSSSAYQRAISRLAILEPDFDESTYDQLRQSEVTATCLAWLRR